MAVPNTFASATSAIPLANLDANFAYYDAGFSLSGSAVTFAGAITLTSGTANGVPYLNASKVLTSGGVLTFDGTILSSTRFAGALNGTVGATTANTGAFTTLTTSSTVTLNGGTANGVAYLDGSKVLTTGSALTFNGSTLTVAPDANRAFQLASAGTFSMLLQNNSSDSGASILYNTNGTHLFQLAGTSQALLTSSGLEVKQSQLIGYSSYAGIGTNGLAVAGNVGIGTSSPAYKLDVDGGLARFTRSSKYLLVNPNYNAADTNVDFETNSGMAFTFTQGTSERMRLDSSGNLGLGASPSAWATSSTAKAFEIGTVGNALYGFSGSNINLTSGAYYNSGWKYAISSLPVSYYNQSNGLHQWYTAPSGTAGNAITFTQAMTLDASGNLGIGTSSPSLGLTVEKDNGSGYIAAFRANNTSPYLTIQTTSSITQIQGINSAFSATNDIAMQLSGGNVGIGTSSPTNKLEVASSTTNTGITIYNNYVSGGQNARLGFKSLNGYDGSSVLAAVTAVPNASGNTATSLVFSTSGDNSLASAGLTERARIDSSGNLLVGTTSGSARLSVQGGDVFIGANNNIGVGAKVAITSGGNGIHISTPDSSAALAFFIGSTNVGSVTVSGSLTSYNVTSDQRLKENIVDAPEFGSVIDSIQVRSFDWKTGQFHQRAGFIAQELVTVAPEAVHQPTNPEEMMAVDYSKLVPMLVKEIQDLRKRLAALEAA